MTIITIALLGFQGQHRQVTAIEFFGDMKRQDKVKFQKPSSFFADGRAARPPVDGTIPMGYDIPGHPMQNSEAPKDDIRFAPGRVFCRNRLSQYRQDGRSVGHRVYRCRSPRNCFNVARKNSRSIARFVTARPGRGMGSPRNMGCLVLQTITRTSTDRWPTARSSIRSRTVLTP